MDVRFELQTGWPSKTALRSRISQYVRDAISFKIGITHNPHSRAHGYESTDPYDEMIVLYRTSSIANVRRMEEMVIDLYSERPDNDNVNRGGGGPASEEGPYYLYVVTW